MLVRHYIHQRLQRYYAQSATSVVGGVEDPIAFRSLWGEWGWKRLYDRLYRESSGQWLTPTELFQPYYSQCIAEWIVERIRSSSGKKKRTDIVEVGGGRGTNARCILQHVETKYPDVFREQLGNYHLIDSSPTLLKLQEERTQEFATRMRFRLCDMKDVAEGDEDLLLPPQNNDNDERHTILVLCEVLDNLPHDRVACRRGHYYETQLVETDGHLHETECPVNDPLLQSCLATHPNYTIQGWYPTTAIAMIQKMLSKTHGCDLWVADFDDLSTRNGEPLVTDMNGIDHIHYLAASGTDTCTDILFPTDFRLLTKVVGTTAQRNIQIQKQADFLRGYPEIVNQTKTMFGGYSPMVDDFPNCSVFTVEHDH